MKSLIQKKDHDKKQAAGFSAAGRNISRQPKLLVSKPGDRYEQEANRMAGAVMVGQPSFIRTKFNEGSQYNIVNLSLQTKKEHASNETADVAESIFSTQGRGGSMDYDTGSFMSSRFGTDFSNVKIHQDSEAVRLSRNLNAQAFTVGNDIYFNEGKYAPGSAAGRHLLAHELTHTVQQGATPVALQKQDEDDKTFTPKPEIEYKFLPPDFQLKLYHFLLQADTSKVHLDFQTRSFMAGVSYSYGDALSLKLRFRDFTTKLGWVPGDNAFSFGASQGPFSGGLTAKPGENKFGLSLNFGAPLLPMQDQMAGTFAAGGTSAGNMMTGLPGALNDPLAWYKQFKPDIENVSKTADLVKQITGAGKNTIRFGAGFSLTYDPVNSVVISGRVGMMF